MFNTKTQLGTFTNAYGIAELGERGERNRSMFGTLEPDVYFYGEAIEKIGPDKYRITQRRLHDLRAADAAVGDRQRHAPRSTSHDYAHAQQRRDPREGRAGVLPADAVLPDPGRRSRDRVPDADLRRSSLARDQSISNAFFWAINRSQDATFFHDWLFSRGTGIGAEYRYMLGAAVAGQLPVLLRSTRTRR